MGNTPSLHAAQLPGSQQRADILLATSQREMQSFLETLAPERVALGLTDPMRCEADGNGSTDVECRAWFKQDARDDRWLVLRFVVSDRRLDGVKAADVLAPLFRDHAGLSEETQNAVVRITFKSPAGVATVYQLPEFCRQQTGMRTTWAACHVQIGPQMMATMLVAPMRPDDQGRVDFEDINRLKLILERAVLFFVPQGFYGSAD